MLPDFLKMYFWDCDVTTLDAYTHKRFIAERILMYGDAKALQWLDQILSENELAGIIATSKKLDVKTRNYWRIATGVGNKNWNFAKAAKVPI